MLILESGIFLIAENSSTLDILIKLFILISLTELTKHMNKSKSTLYHHLRKMINFGLI
ncbi:MAG: ArsR family transcriptional regulator [Promethearchaeota archaeon]